MTRRSVLGRLGSAVAAVLVWQTVFVAPAPVLADDPIPPGYIDCGNGFVCGNTGSGPGDNIVVTGPEDRIIQTNASAPWSFLEEEAKGAVAAIHQIPVDSRLTDWGRDELRAYIFARLLAIAAKNSNERTPQEQAALTQFQQLVKQKQIDGAQNAVNLYNQWNANLCGFRWPSEVSANPNEYINRTEVRAFCTNPYAGLAGRPASPGADEFTAMGTAKAFSQLATDPDGQRIQDEMITGSVFLGGLAAAGIAAGIAAAITFATPAIVAALVATVFPFAAGAGATLPSVVAAFSGIAAAGTVAAAILGAVFVVVFAAVVIGIALWQQITQAQVPINLRNSLNSFNGTPLFGPPYTPDINAMAGTDEGLGTLWGVFNLQTLPDYSDRRVSNPAAHTDQDPTFHVVQHIPFFGGQINNDLGVVNAIVPEAEAVNHLLQNAYLTGGWWANRVGNGTRTYRLRIPYVAPDGEPWQAGTTQVKVDATAIVPAHLEPALILEHTGHQADSRILRSGQSFDFRGSGGETYTATLIAPTVNWPPLVKPTVEGTLAEGGTVTFHANAVDPNDDTTTPGDEDPLSFLWLIEPSNQGPAVIITGADGQSQIDHCYTNPFSNDPLTNCPWDVATGPDPTHTYVGSGDLHVHVIATDSHGATASQVFRIRIVDVPPPVTMTDPQTAFSFDEGGSLSLPGSFNDPGDDQVKVNVDWGDGNNESQWFPCDSAYKFGDGIQCGTIRLPVPGADHPQAFSFGPHKFTDDPPGAATDYTVTLKAFDDDGFTTKTFTVTVANVAPVLSLACGVTLDPGLGGNPFGCQTRYAEAGTPIPLNGLFDDPGSDTWTLDVNWGDGHTNQYTYPCPVGAPCPFQSNSNVFLFPAQAGREFFGLSHAYSANGYYPITVSIDDGDGGFDSDGAAAAATSDLVDDLPTALITTPTDNATYTFGQSVLADYSCADDRGVASCTGPVTSGSALDTLTVGQHTFTVTAIDDASQVGQTTFHYSVVPSSADDHPIALINVPVDGASYTLGQSVATDYACADDHTVASCVGPVASGSAMDTSTLGDHTFTVTAMDNASQTDVNTLHYNVAPAPPVPDADPTATITTPEDGATYTLGQSVLASYSCADDHSVVTCAGPVGSGSAIDTSSVGQHTFTVTATDTASQSGATTFHYNVVAPPIDAHPTASVSTPADGATYTLGQFVLAGYSCADDHSVASCIGPVGAGSAIDTSSVGPHTFTVTATDGASQTGATTVHYNVIYAFMPKSPLVVSPGVNEATAHKFRVWFSLGGNQGLPITRALTLHQGTNCDTGAPIGRWKHARLSRVGYSARQGMYFVVWRAAPAWAGTCRQLELRLNDGTDRILLFHFAVAP